MRFDRAWMCVLGGCGALAMTACSSSQSGPKASPGELARRPAQINANTYFAHGFLLERQGNFDGAVAQYTEALRLNPSMLSARNRLGICHNKLGRHAQATAAFRQAVAQHPSLAYLHNNLGFSLLLEGKYDEALQTLSRAIELNPKFNRARMNQGIALGKLGRMDEAYEAFARICNPADAHYNLAMIEADAARYVEAARSLEAALALQPDLDAAQRQLVQFRELAERAEARRAAEAAQAAPPIVEAAADATLTADATIADHAADAEPVASPTLKPDTAPAAPAPETADSTTDADPWSFESVPSTVEELDEPAGIHDFRGIEAADIMAAIETAADVEPAADIEPCGQVHDDVRAAGATPGEPLFITFTGDDLRIGDFDCPDEQQDIVLIDGSAVMDDETTATLLWDALGRYVSFVNQQHRAAAQPAQPDARDSADQR
ncbi:MAG: hypothetical protein CHACPFDD_03680 [Phycisphaerae bacterium]|nr:hypothetical protein [Phycisphaerae bacterium]